MTVESSVKNSTTSPILVCTQSSTLSRISIAPSVRVSCIHDQASPISDPFSPNQSPRLASPSSMSVQTSEADSPASDSQPVKFSQTSETPSPKYSNQPIRSSIQSPMPLKYSSTYSFTAHTTVTLMFCLYSAIFH